MKSRVLAVCGCIALVMMFSGVGAVADLSLGPPAANAAVSKSLDAGGGGGGNAAGAGNRFGSLLSGWGVPIITAVAGCLLIGALAARNIGGSVGIILITLLALIFFLAPDSVQSFAKSVANTVF